MINTSMKKKLVLKIGTSTLTAQTERISHGKIEDIARQILALKNEYNIVLVSSGAIAAARQFIAVNKWGAEIRSKQAMAAIGQPLLMQIYNEIFNDFGLKAAQCLMTYRDFENAASRKNTRTTIDMLLLHDYIPIINENDTVSTEEIVLGDNDKLSALVAALIDADLLVLATDTYGLFDKDPHAHADARFIKEVTDLNVIARYAEEKKSKLGTGGMASKLHAAAICKENDIEMWIINAQNKNFLTNAMKEKTLFTKFT